MDPSALTKTGFCGKTVDNVTNNELKRYINKHPDRKEHKKFVKEKKKYKILLRRL